MNYWTIVSIGGTVKNMVQQFVAHNPGDFVSHGNHSKSEQLIVSGETVSQEKLKRSVALFDRKLPKMLH